MIRKCLTKPDYEKQHFLRSKGGYLPYPNYNNKFLNSFFPAMFKTWNNLPTSTKCKNLGYFKAQLKTDLKPERFKHFAVGPNESNSLLTRFRTGRTNLNANKFTLGQTYDPSCLSHASSENSEHYFLDCCLYTVERQNLFSLVEYSIPFPPN